MYILKFGGTSMGDAASIRRAADIICDKARERPVIAIVSAMSGVTDTLIRSGEAAAAQTTTTVLPHLKELREKHYEALDGLLTGDAYAVAREKVDGLLDEADALLRAIRTLGECSPRTRDRLMAFGELMSSELLAAFLKDRISTELGDSRRLIVTDDHFGAARVDFDATKKNITGWLGQRRHEVCVLQGFIAADEQGQTTTLGRGGSDYTAAIIGASVPGAEVEIWTDVPGMMTADPRLVPAARTIESLSFQEAMELSHFGAKVLYPPTVLPLMKAGLPLRIRNTFAPLEPGTLVQAQEPKGEGIIRGISSILDISLITLEGSGMVGIPGFSHRLFGALARQGVNVILITQASSEHTICVAVDAAQVTRATGAVAAEFRAETRDGSLEPLQCENGLAIVALVGDQMKNHSGISGRMFGALGRNGVNIRAIAQGASERNISTVIAAADVRKAVNVLHEAFFETAYKQVNVFIAGVGNVGRKLLEQLRQQQPWLLEHLHLQLRVTGLANSRRMCVRAAGIDLENWEAALAEGEESDAARFAEKIGTLNLRNSVFVDATAQESVAGQYAALLRRSIAVVACNKVAASAGYDGYRALKDLSREFNAPFFFETNVGAGLPVISTLGDLRSSGDRVQRIEAVLSGTLNFVFNNYDGSRPFAEVVQAAQNGGYTEPDPRLDLSGTDVARKILILAREAGLPLQLQDVANEPFLPASCFEGSIEDFYTELQRQEPHFLRLLEAARGAGKRLKYVARLEGGAASVGLEAVDAQHDFYHLYGKDNVVRFFTNRYTEQPLVVKGAGAGAEVTASGVFADIIKTART
ncbi:MAG: bifunctional aspartate kinase/homoserine dehydrogenase I [Chitinophagaceae bacterium]|nr:MAG: bifunctional aspartate kinase/homoserine dehydrogenase I [Chitinophagaceae bacterium]